jgi:hypothetical protein
VAKKLRTERLSISTEITMVKGANLPKILTVLANFAKKLRTETVFKFYVESHELFEM